MMTETEATPDTPLRAPGRAARVLFAVIAILLVLHLVGDRLTPFTSQARVHARVVPIASEVGGRIETIHVRNDQIMKGGEPLFTLDDANFLIAIEKAEADIAATMREQAAQDAGITLAQTQRQIAVEEQRKADLDWTRHQRIFAEDSGALSQRRMELSRAAAIEAAARVRAADAQVAQARAARGLVTNDNDRLIAARSALSRAKLDLARTTVRAPGPGVVTDLRIERGQVANPGSPIMSFISFNDGWVTADMTENNLGLIRPGARAEIVLDAMPGQVIRGTVRSVGYGVASGGRSQPGGLTEVTNSRDFLRSAQRFPVIVDFADLDPQLLRHLREGGQADVIVYASENPVMEMLGWLTIRAAALASYAY
jgi:multidrug resistance efflux pump